MKEKKLTIRKCPFWPTVHIDQYAVPMCTVGQKGRFLYYCDSTTTKTTTATSTSSQNTKAMATKTLLVV